MPDTFADFVPTADDDDDVDVDTEDRLDDDKEEDDNTEETELLEEWVGFGLESEPPPPHAERPAIKLNENKK